MMKGVKFGNYHSFKNWGLILKSRPVVSPPEPKTIYIDITGADNAIDLTESLTGDVKFKTRKMSFEFTVIDGRDRWSNIYSEILDCIHGQKMKIVLDDDPDYFYLGRITVDEWKSDKRTAVISISAVVDAYKYEQFSSVEDWEWDSFNFETGIIRGDLKDIHVDGTYSFYFTGSRLPVVPKITVDTPDDAGLKISLNNYKDTNVSANFADGTTTNPKFVFRERNEISITGTGTVTFDYRGGRL